MRWVLHQRSLRSHRLSRNSPTLARQICGGIVGNVGRCPLTYASIGSVVETGSLCQKRAHTWRPIAEVGYWHKADVPLWSMNVRCREENGRAPLLHATSDRRSHRSRSRRPTYDQRPFGYDPAGRTDANVNENCREFQSACASIHPHHCEA
jgi:hypothetical protein